MLHISEIRTGKPEDQRTALEHKVHDILHELEIPYHWVDNDSVSSMEECVEISKILGAEIRKSILLCNRQKTSFYLLVLPAEKSFDAKAFSKVMEVPRLSFASSELMEKHLGVTPGAATIMGLINDNAGAVQLVIDQEVANNEFFACNPGANTSHLKMKTEDLLSEFLPHIGHPPQIVSL
ncbi:MAG: prolyl-tRNA synthetase associated domain-containing protein [Tindallia sp. MSAO_Bac2]|nr:MAG: prolyl-tRNA synthetase associated domain-containing protein [Tindallia sp. MSAO_Bac2]